jgi:hypothetical protein
MVCCVTLLWSQLFFNGPSGFYMSESGQHLLHHGSPSQAAHSRPSASSHSFHCTKLNCDSSASEDDQWSVSRYQACRGAGTRNALPHTTPATQSPQEEEKKSSFAGSAVCCIFFLFETRCRLHELDSCHISPVSFISHPPLQQLRPDLQLLQAKVPGT